MPLSRFSEEKTREVPRHNETEGCRTLPGSLEAVYEMGAYLMSLDEER